MLRRVLSTFISVLVVLAPLGLSPTGAAAEATLPTGVWLPAAAPAPSGFDRNTVLLQDGRVMAVGYGGVVGLYDPAANAWASGSRLWASVQPVVLADGRVFAAGGSLQQGGFTARAELYDPSADTWSPAASMPVGRYGHTMALLADGRVLLAGGLVQSGGYWVAAPYDLVYDPAANSWTQLAPTSPQRNGATLTRLADGTVLMVGGYHYELSKSATTAALFDPVAMTWTGIDGPPVVPATPTLDQLADGRVLVVGGGVPQLFDPATRAWSQTAPMHRPRHWHDTAMLPDGRILVTGGDWWLTSTELYDPVANQWTPSAPLNEGRHGHAAVTLLDGRVLAVGGQAASAELFSFADTGHPALLEAAATPSSKRFNETSELTALIRASAAPIVAAEFTVTGYPTAPMAISDWYGYTKATATLGADLPVGWYTVSIRAQDAAGEWTPPRSVSIEVRPNQAPYIRGDSSFSKRVDRTGTYEVVATDDGSLYSVVGAEFFIGTDPGVGQATPMTLTYGEQGTTLSIELGTDIPLGSYEAGVRAVDDEGLWSQVFHLYVNVWADTEPPQLEPWVRLSPSYKNVAEEATVEVVSYSYDTVGAEFFLDSDPGVGNGTPMEVVTGSGRPLLQGRIGTDVPVGTHNVYVRGVDDSGNWSTTVSGMLTVWQDTVGPTVEYAYVRVGGREVYAVSYDRDHDLAAMEFFIGADPGPGNGIAMTRQGPIEFYAALPEPRPTEDYVLSVRAVDHSGNWGPVVERLVEVDNEAPVIQWAVASPQPKWVNETGTITGRATDNWGHVHQAEWFVGADPGQGKGTQLVMGWDGWLSGPLGTDLPVGDLTLYVRAADASGNWSEPFPVPLTVWQDTTAPVVSSVTATPDVMTVRDAAQVVVEASDDRQLAGGEYTVDGGAPVAMTATSTGFVAGVGPLPVGEHVVTVRAVDGVGNWSAPASTTVAVFDPAAGSVFGGGWLDAAASSDGAKSSFRIEAGYDGAEDRTANGRLEVQTGTVALKATEFRWIAVDRATGSFSGVATASAKPGEAPWTIRFQGRTGSGSTVSFELYRPGQSTPAVTVSGAPKGSFSMRP